MAGEGGECGPAQEFPLHRVTVGPRSPADFEDFGAPAEWHMVSHQGLAVTTSCEIPCPHHPLCLGSSAAGPLDAGHKELEPVREGWWAALAMWLAFEGLFQPEVVKLFVKDVAFSDEWDTGEEEASMEVLARRPKTRRLWRE